MIMYRSLFGVLVWLFFLNGCVSITSNNKVDVNSHIKKVNVHVRGGKTVYMSDGCKSTKIEDLVGVKRKPNSLEVVFSDKMTHSQIAQIKDDINSLGIPIVSFEESAFGLISNMSNGERVTRSMMMETISKRGTIDRCGRVRGKTSSHPLSLLRSKPLGK